MFIQLFRNAKISVRMIIGFSLLLVLMIILIGVGIFSLIGMQQRLDAIVHENMIKIELSQNMRFLARHEAVIIRNILLQRDNSQKEKEIKRREEARRQYETAEEKLISITNDEHSKTIMAAMVDGKQATRPLWDRVVQLGLANKSDEGIRVLVTETRQVQWKWLDSLDELQKTQSKIAQDSAENAVRAYRRALAILIGIGAAAVLLGVFIAFMITRGITRPLNAFSANVERIAAGDMTTILACDTHDEIGVLGKKINTMAEFLDTMIHDMMVSANEVVGAVAILKSRALKTSQGAQNQSGQANQIATSAEEMSQTITDIAKNASTVAESSAEAKDAATAGQEVAAMGIKKANSVYDSTVELAARVEKLTKRIGEIGDIVTVITGIADQTNLLALNAAIEAARAGEQGRGFAVVADEVRKLAERTIKATAEISGKIGAVQEESSQTAQVMGESSAQVTELKKFISNVGGALEMIVETVQKVSDQIARIAAAVEEQSAASEDVAKNIDTTSVIAKEMEKAAGDMTHEINGLTLVAENLRNSTARFKTKSGKLMILDLAKTDHQIFIDKIGSCLNGDGNLDPAQLPDHRSCRFGKWYYTEGRKTCGALDCFKKIDGPHEKIHSLAKYAVAAAHKGDKDKAMHMYHEMEDMSGQIGSLLDQIKSEAAA